MEEKECSLLFVFDKSSMRNANIWSNVNCVLIVKGVYRLVLFAVECCFFSMVPSNIYIVLKQ